ncbi:unnamed protein product [Diatraea saccharalis]|uniref:Uncharacterized protein n=1 Tax=Diatraea saccharalis TaxID=40085 RepID=A0A9N9WHY1_9NEOP|nr:unnamed protein product [Diatraea saccharalis]
MVCASTPDGCSRRSFMDQCDMYEFNCDYGTPTIMTTFSPTTTPLIITTGSFSSTTTKSIYSQTTTEMTTSPTTTTNITEDTYNIYEDDRIPNTTKIQTSPNTYYSKVNSTLINDTSDANDTSIMCCHRPKTWETTSNTDRVIIYIDESNAHISSNLIESSTIEMNTPANITYSRATATYNTKIEIQETTKNIDTLTNYIDSNTILDYGVDDETNKRISTDYIKTSQTFDNISHTINATTTEENLPSITVTDHITFTNCCDRSSIITKETQTTDSNTLITIQTTTENESKTIDTSICCERPKTWKTTEQSKLPPVTFDNSTSTVSETLETTCFPEPCNSNEFNECCQRPKTWETTEGTTLAAVTFDLSTSHKTPYYTTKSKHNEITDEMTATFYNSIEDSTIIHDVTSITESVTISTTELPTTTYPTTTEYSRATTIETATYSPVEELTTDPYSHTSKEVLTQKNTKGISPTTWWYPKFCKSDNCKRPITWETTERRTRRRRY